MVCDMVLSAAQLLFSFFCTYAKRYKKNAKPTGIALFLSFSHSSQVKQRNETHHSYFLTMSTTSQKAKRSTHGIQ
jgi:hypothetical protein